MKIKSFSQNFAQDNLYSSFSIIKKTDLIPLDSYKKPLDEDDSDNFNQEQNAQLHTIVLAYVRPVGAVLIIGVGCRTNVPLCPVRPDWST